MSEQKLTQTDRDHAREELKTSKYADILGKPHHVSARRTPMELSARAAQFAPFAALNGHKEAIAEAEKQE